MIPASVFEYLSGTPLSAQMRDTAMELSQRITHGEYDALGDMQRSDLDVLVQVIEHWARRALDLEAAMLPPASAQQARGADS